MKEKKFVESSYRVLYADTDQAGVMYYANYLKVFELGRAEFMRALGFTYKELEEKEGIILPVVETYIKYKAPARYDELITVKTTLKEVKSFKIVFEYQIYYNHSILAYGFTKHVPVNKEGKIVRLPEPLLKVLREVL